MNRHDLIRHFLAGSGYETALIAPLAQDASFRRYWRLTGGPHAAVLMDAPPPEDVRPFLRIGEHLSRIGLSVPRIFKADTALGLVLEEDLGDDLLSAMLDAAPETDQTNGRADEWPDERTDDRPGTPGGAPGGTTTVPSAASPTPSPGPATLLHAAAQSLVALQRAEPPPNLPAWGAEAMAAAALGTLFEWWWPARFGTPAQAAARDDIAAALAAVLAPLDDGPRCFVHRDFFAGNLLWLPDRRGQRESRASSPDNSGASSPDNSGASSPDNSGASSPLDPDPRAIGIIDFQGAAIGHPAYDLVSLLQDARRDIDPAIAAAVIGHYLTLRPELDPEAFRAAYAACAAQRHLRVACQWVRLAMRDSRPQYLVHAPRTWRLLNQALREPAVAPLAQALDRWIPAEQRGNPPGLAA